MVDLVSYAAEFSFILFISTVSHAFIIAWNNGILFLHPDATILFTFLALYFYVGRFQYAIVRSFDLKYGKYAIFACLAITKDYDNLEGFSNIQRVFLFLLGVLGVIIVTDGRGPLRDDGRAHHGRAGAGAGAPGEGWHARWYGMEHSHDLQRIDFVISCGVEKNKIVNKILWVVVYVLSGVILLLLLEKLRVEFMLISCSVGMMAFQVDTRVKIPVPALDVLCFSVCYHTVGFIKGGQDQEASLYSGIIMFCGALLFLAFSIMLQGLEAFITSPAS